MTYQDKVIRIHKDVQQYLDDGLKIFTTSSFQSHSIPLLHILKGIYPDIPVYFLNTGFHFPETQIFKETVRKELNLNILDLTSPVSKLMQRDGSGKFHYASNPEFCCYLNKILPLEPILRENDVWIAGVRASQNKNRASFSFEEKGKFNTLRYHPILDWTTKEIWQYSKEFNLPKHPLDDKGYVSIGCEPCTQRFDLSKMDSVRDGRWAGLNKSECGLHTELVKK